MKNILIAMVPMCLLASSVMAQDDLFSDLASGKSDSINAATSELQDLSLSSLDVAALSENAGDQAKADTTVTDDAIEACFRRCGYWGGYGGCYSSCWYNSCWYNPCYYTYYCYRPVYYSCYYPTCYSYWGCY